MESLKRKIKAAMVINQPFAIGDILFLEPMYRHFWNLHDAKPIVPVQDHLFWISNYIDSAHFVPVSQFKLDYDSMRTDNPDYFPAKYANQILKGLASNDHHDFENMMLDKYILAKLDPMLWKQIRINFVFGRGEQLAQKLGLNIFDRDYILVNNHSQAGTIHILPESPGRIVYMHQVPGYNVLDWFLIMMFARENHHVSTSTFYIFQAMKNMFAGLCQETEIYLYPRPNVDGLRGISKLDPDFKYNFPTNQVYLPHDR